MKDICSCKIAKKSMSENVFNDKFYKALRDNYKGYSIQYIRYLKKTSVLHKEWCGGCERVEIDWEQTLP